jgi:phage protein U
MKKQDIVEVSPKSTKDQILAAYNEVLEKLNEKRIASPQEEKKKQEEEVVVIKATSNSSDTILSDLSTLKSKTIKQIDSLSEQLLGEFQKLANLREAITLEQTHLRELYQINETANTLSALLQTQAEEKERFKLKMDETKQAFEEDMAMKKSHWQQRSEQLEQDYKEQKERSEKSRKREEEDYTYTLELKRRKETDEYNNKKSIMEKELSDLKDDLLKREADVVEKEKAYNSLKIQVEQFPNVVKEAVENAEKLLRTQLAQQYDFETQLKQKEYDGILKLNERSINYFEDVIQKQDSLIKELTGKADMATQQVQSIAYRALDASAQRFVTLNAATDKEKGLQGA